MARKPVDISKEQYQEALTILEQGGTKKAACDVLGIAYNTKRLDKLLDEHVKKQEVDKKVRAKKRKQAVTDIEVAEWVTSYLNGASLSQLSDTYFRSIQVIKYHLEKHGAMLRQAKVDKLNPPMLPDLCVADEFEEGQYVWSSAYNCVAIVKSKFKNAYRIHVLGNGVQEFSYQPASELGCLKHLQKLGVRLESFTDYTRADEVQLAIYETMQKANKAAKEKR